MKHLILILIITTFISCQNLLSDNTETLQQEPWMTTNFIDSTQILLTNQYLLNSASGNGASSFLIQSKSDTFLCTAKHLLGNDMGIRPEVTTDSFDLALKYWYAFPRFNKLSSDTIIVKELISQEINDKDIILLSYNSSKENNIEVLTPRFSKVKSNEKLFIIGCEYSDEECHQRKYAATMDSYSDGFLWIKPEIEFRASGFSGAPVIDKKGYVVGVLSGGGDYDGETYLVLEPIFSAKKWLEM